MSDVRRAALHSIRLATTSNAVAGCGRACEAESSSGLESWTPLLLSSRLDFNESDRLQIFLQMPVKLTTDNDPDRLQFELKCREEKHVAF